MTDHTATVAKSSSSSTTTTSKASHKLTVVEFHNFVSKHAKATEYYIALGHDRVSALSMAMVRHISYTIMIHMFNTVYTAVCACTFIA